MTENNFPFYAIICAWNEEDIIHATIKNLYCQGCDKVFIVDNGSSDNTKTEAIRAKGITYYDFYTKYFNEEEKVKALNSCVMAINRQYTLNKTWWIYVDADEFPLGTNGKTIREYIQTLPDNVRAVSSTIYEHYPSINPFYIRDFHPIDFQLFAAKSHIKKTQLFRYEREKPHIISLGGFHTYNTQGDYIIEADDKIDVHHFRFRDLKQTSSRLKELTKKRDDGTTRNDWMDTYQKKNLKNSKSMYRTRLKEAIDLREKYKNIYFSMEKLPYNISSLRTWYNNEELSNTVSILSNERDYKYWSAFHSFFQRDTTSAICKFNDILNIENDAALKQMVFIKIIECFLIEGEMDALNPLKNINCSTIEVKEMITRLLTSYV